MDPTPVELTVDPKRLAGRVLVFCLGAIVLFVFLDYHINFGRWIPIGAMRRLFNIAREDGLASWFATTQTLMAGLTLGLIHLAARKRFGMRWAALGWLVLAAFFVYMAIDDGAQLHERLGSTFGARIPLGFFPSYSWQLLFLPIFGALGLFMLVFLWRRFESTSSRVLLLTAIGLQACSVGLDFFEGLDVDHPWNPYTVISESYEIERWTQARFGEAAYDTLQHFSRALEEALEMAAISLLWFLFLKHLGVAVGDLRIRFLIGKSIEDPDRIGPQ